MKKPLLFLGLVILLSGCWLLDYEDYGPYEFVVNNVTPYTVYVWVDPETAPGDVGYDLIDYETPDATVPPYSEQLIRDDLEGWHLIYAENEDGDKYWGPITREVDADYTLTLSTD